MSILCLQQIKDLKIQKQQQYEQEGQDRLEKDRQQINNQLKKSITRNTTSFSLKMIGLSDSLNYPGVIAVHPVNLEILAKEMEDLGYNIDRAKNCIYWINGEL